MDLGTIKQRLKNNYYLNAAACIADIEVVFENCFKFNPAGDDVHKMGQTVLDFARLLIAKMPTTEIFSHKYVLAPTKKRWIE